MTYLFAVTMRDGESKATFSVKNLPDSATAEVMVENRSLKISRGRFSGDFKGYQVHLYKCSQ